MQISLLDTLKNISPPERVNYIQEIYKKNLTYFASNHPYINHILTSLKENPYQLNLTDTFFEIQHTCDNSLCHPEMGLEKMSRLLGQWTHEGWVELFEPRVKNLPLESWHKTTYDFFYNFMQENFPDFKSRRVEGKIQLPETGPKRRFSNSVVFAGIFHGLHIAHFLSQTDINNIALIEPDPFRFEVSCYFLDYAALDACSKGLLLYVGEPTPGEFFDVLLRKAIVTSQVWLRILPGYTSDSITNIINTIRVKWLQRADTWLDADRQLQAIENGTRNLKGKQRLLVRIPKLSQYSRIAVIGAGPSLAEDFTWLQKNQDKLIIFASHTSVRALMENNITPDFQFSLDLEWNDVVEDNLRLDSDIPFIVSYQMNPRVIKKFNHILMVSGETTASPAEIVNRIPSMYPTTGNMAFAIAHYCQPAELYLLGLDFGFRSTEKIHVSGSHFDHNTVSIDRIKGIEQLSVAPNFSTSNDIVSRPYFIQSLEIVENALLNSKNRTSVFNLSDGAKIKGTKAKRSSQIHLTTYLMKKTDTAAIIAAFEESSINKHWKPFEIEGKDLLQEFKNQCRESLFLKPFSFHNASILIDKCQFTINNNCKSSSSQDTRMIPYLRVLKDLLTTWYRFIIYAQSSSEAEQVYKKGYTAIVDIVDAFEWK